MVEDDLLVMVERSLEVAFEVEGLTSFAVEEPESEKTEGQSRTAEEEGLGN